MAAWPSQSKPESSAFPAPNRWVSRWQGILFIPGSIPCLSRTTLRIASVTKELRLTGSPSASHSGLSSIKQTRLHLQYSLFLLLWGHCNASAVPENVHEPPKTNQETIWSCGNQPQESLYSQTEACSYLTTDSQDGSSGVKASNTHPDKVL